jgi:cytoskeletal protein RodZ
MESVGARLKKMRLQKGLSLEEVNKKTKIHLKILKAIEEDALVDLNPVYIKGFLKIYCQFLGLEPRDFIPDYKEPQGAAKHAPNIHEKPPSAPKSAALKFDFWGSKTTKFFIYVLIFILLSFGLFKLGKVISLKRSSLTKKSNKLSKPLNVPAEKKTTISKTEKKDTTLVTAKPVSVEVSPQKSAPVPAAVRLVIQAKESCWVSLKVDGHAVFQNILKKGRSETWQAKDKIELSLGNAGVVDLEINGKLISNLGRRGQSLKDILITKEGLTVGR